MNITIFNPTQWLDGQAIYEDIVVPVTSDSKLTGEIMKAETLRLDFKSSSCVRLNRMAMVEYNGKEYYLIADYTPAQQNEAVWKYDVSFVEKFHTLQNKMAFFVSGESREADWSLTDTPANHLSAMRNCILDSDVYDNVRVVCLLGNTETKTISYQTIDIISALNSIANTYECEWWYEYEQNEVVIYLGKCEVGQRLTLEVGNNIQTAQEQTATDETATRYYAFGSTRNIQQDYDGSTLTQLVNKRLALPKSLCPNGYYDVVEMPDAMHSVKTLVFEDIYPKSNFQVLSVRTVDVPYEDDRSKTWQKFFIKLIDTDIVQVVEVSLAQFIASVGSVYKEGIYNVVASGETYIVWHNQSGWHYDTTEGSKFAQGTAPAQAFTSDKTIGLTSRNAEVTESEGEKVLFEVVVSEGDKDGDLHVSTFNAAITQTFDTGTGAANCEDKLASDTQFSNSYELRIVTNGAIKARRTIGASTITYNKANKSKTTQLTVSGFYLDTYEDEKCTMQIVQTDARYVVTSSSISANSKVSYKVKCTAALSVGAIEYKEETSFAELESYAYEFDTDLRVTGKSESIHFENGILVGREFEMNYHESTREFEIIKDEGDKIIIPNSVLCPHAGDRAILFNVRMPQEYIDAAEIKLYEALQREVADRQANHNNYTIKSNPVAFNASGWLPSIGQKVRVVNTDEVLETRILSFERQLDIPAVQSFKVGNAKITGTISTLKDEVKNISAELASVSGKQDTTAINLGGASHTHPNKAKLDTIDIDAAKLVTSDGEIVSAKWEGRSFDDFLDQPIRKADTAILNGLRSEEFLDGVLGYGYMLGKMPDGSTKLSVDNLLVRQAMVVTELCIDKIRAVGGSMVVTAANGTIASVNEINTQYVLEFENVKDASEMPFVAGDLIRCQSWQGAEQETLKSYWVEVKNVASVDIEKEDEQGAVVRYNCSCVFVDKADFTASTPAVGDEIVLMGNTTDAARQGAVVISAMADATTAEPRVIIYDGINTTSLAGKLKAVFGCLNGITDATFGALSGYGLFAENVYLKGKFAIAGSGGTSQSVDSALNEILGVANAASTNASNAVTTANQAKTSASQANTTANTAKTTAEQAKQDVKVYQDALASTTEIQGGLVLTNTILLKDNSGLVQGGISGSNDTDIAFFAGNTLAQALNGNAKVLIKKTGDAKFGLLQILRNGVITMVNRGKQVLKIMNQNVTTDFSAGLLNNTYTLTSKTESVSGTSGTINYSFAYTNFIVESKFDGAIVQSGTITTTITTANKAGIRVTLQLLKGSNEYEQHTVYINQSGATATTITDTWDLSGISLESGTYTIRAKYNVTSGNYSGSQIAVSNSGGINVYCDINEPRTEFGNNGILVGKDGLNYFRAAINNGVLNIDARGGQDFSGLLYAGSATNKGVLTKSYGVRSLKLTSTSHPSTGVYEYSISGLSSVPCVNAIPISSSSANYHCLIASQTASKIQVRCLNGTSLIDIPFNLFIYGTL